MATNFEKAIKLFKDKQLIHEECINEIRLTKDFIIALYDGRYEKLEFCNLSNWNEEYKTKIKLTKFEYDLLASIVEYEDYKFMYDMPLLKMQVKGYFNEVDTSLMISEILENCEVIDNV